MSERMEAKLRLRVGSTRSTTRGVTLGLPTIINRPWQVL
jgi:hypothetical protein